MQHEKHSKLSYFVTLTYDTQYIPYTIDGKQTLDKSDIQNFFKRLRHYSRNHPLKELIKYYAVGEYGGKTQRPHYHIILFNADIENINKAWTKGTNFIGHVSGASVGYTLKYISKNNKLSKDDRRTPQFSLMSKGIGLQYLTPNIISYHRNDIGGRNHCTTEQGYKISMPRYYRNRIYGNDIQGLEYFHYKINIVYDEESQRIEKEPVYAYCGHTQNHYKKLATFHLQKNLQELEFFSIITPDFKEKTNYEKLQSDFAQFREYERKQQCEDLAEVI